MKYSESFEESLEGLLYDPEEGRLFRIQEIKIMRETTRGRAESQSVLFKRKTRRYTHVIYYIMTGEFPEVGFVVDHKDTNPWNNKWNNLRLATPKQNAQNRSPTNQYGYPGISKSPHEKYCVAVDATYRGTFETVEEAIAEARKIRTELHGEFAYQGIINEGD